MMLPWRDAGRIGEMLFEPGAVVPLADAVERRTELRAHALDLVAGVAAVGLIDQRARGGEIRARSTRFSFSGVSFRMNAARAFKPAASSSTGGMTLPGTINDGFLKCGINHLALRWSAWHLGQVRADASLARARMATQAASVLKRPSPASSSG